MRSWIVITAALIILFVLVMLSQGIPWLISNTHWAKVVLFNHEVKFSESSQTISFFDPTNIHTFFPLTYIFSRVYFLLVPSPLLIEFLLSPAIECILLALLAASWLRHSPRNLSYLIVFSVGIYSAFYVYINSFLWFRSIGVWELIVFLIALGPAAYGTSKVKMIIIMPIVLAMIWGDDGIVLLSALLFLLVQLVHSRWDRNLISKLLAISLLAFIADEAAIGFGGLSYYGDYYHLFLNQVSDFVALNFGVVSHLNSQSLPFYRVFTADFAFLTLFGLIPAFLLVHSAKNRIRLRNFVLPGITLMIGLLLRVAYIVPSEGLIFGHFFILVLYLALPLAVLGVVHVSYAEDFRVGNTDHRRSTHSRRVVAMVCVVFGCVLIVSVINNALPVGTITSSTDPRVLYSYLPVAGVYVHNFAPAPLATERISDQTTIFINPTVPKSQYILTSPVPSVISQPPSLVSRDIYYSNGLLMILNNQPLT